MQSELFIGLDLGQRRDPTAIAVIERSVRIADRPDPITWARERTIRHEVRHLEVLPLGTPYTAVTKRTERLCQKLTQLGICTLVVDATGVGLPVIDSLKQTRTEWRIMPVTIGHGFNQTQTDGFWRVPKRDLIAGLQLAFEARHLTISKHLKHTPDLIEQLTTMRATRRLTGVTQYASPTTGHDDLALALSLAWWAIETRRPGQLGVPNPLP